MQNMEVTLSAVGLAIGVVAALFSFLVPILSAPPLRPEERRRITSGVVFAAILIVVLAVLALAKAPPFSSGQHLGIGYLTGGLAAILAAVACSRLLNPGREYWPYPFALALSVALAASSLVLLVLRGDPAEGLLGCALGYTVVAGIFRITYPRGRMLDLSRPLEAGAALAVTLCAACTLGVYYFHSRSQRGWWAFPLALAGFWLIGHVISFAVAAQKSLAKCPVIPMAASAVVSAVAVWVLGSLLGPKLEPSQSIVWVILAGLITSTLIVWLAMSAVRQEGDWPLWLQGSAIAVLLTLFLLVLTFRLFIGFGAAVGLVSAWVVIASALGMGAFAARLPLQTLMVGANFLLLQLFLLRAGSIVGEADLPLHYTLIGLILGVLLPAIYSSFVIEAGVGRALLLGFLGSATPVVLLTLWGPDVILGLMVGLVARQAIGAGFVALVAANERWAPWQAPTALLTLGMAIVSVQFIRSLGFLYQMPRIDKAYLAGIIAIVTVLWVVGLSVYSAFTRQRAGAQPPLTERGEP